MNLDAAIKAAQERLHRQIGQWARAAKRDIAIAAARNHAWLDTQRPINAAYWDWRNYRR